MKTGKREISTKAIDYQMWIQTNEVNIDATEPLSYEPKISVVILAEGVEKQFLDAAVSSVENQTYKRFEVCVATSETEAERPNVSGEYVGFLDGRDLLSKNALYEVAKKLNENPDYDFIYSDEDVFEDREDCRTQPFFKPDWSPDLLLGFDYCSRFSVLKKSLVDKVGGLKASYGSLTLYDVILRASVDAVVGHVDKVLYHVRKDAHELPSKELLKTIKEDAICQRGLQAHLEWNEDVQNWNVIYDVPGNPMVSIIVLSKDNKEVLNQCITSIQTNTEYPKYEIIVVDNGSKNPDEIEEMLKGRAAYIYKPMDFNFSAQNNIGVRASKGEYVLLLNDDVEVVQKDWLGRMLGQAMQPHTGAVGVKLYYPDSTLLQHCGVINMGEGPNHAFAKIDDKENLYFGRNRYTYNFLAVTAACILCSKEKYLEVGGLDETLPVAFNDVDFCMRLFEKGYYNVLRNDVVAYHHESLSRGSDFLDAKKMERLHRELKRLYGKHPAFEGFDPFYNRNLTVHSLDFQINVDYDGLTERNWKVLTEIKGTPKDYQMGIDSIEKGPVLKIKGWSNADNEEVDPFGKQRLLLKLHDDYILEFDTYRPLKGENYNDKKEFYSFIDSSLLKGEGRSYTIGMKYECNDAVYYSWSDIVFETVSDDSVFGSARISDIGERQEHLICSIDGAVKGDSSMHMKGWGFDARDLLHNDYKLKYLAYETKDGYKKVKLHTKYRADLMATYPEHAYMVYAGFEMLVAYNQIKDDIGRQWYFVIEDMRDHTRIHKEIDF